MCSLKINNLNDAVNFCNAVSFVIYIFYLLKKISIDIFTLKKKYFFLYVDDN